jgi:carbonic anhydrase/acetyltransferase-like protein (isoleucine patch superfamily)
MSVAKALPRSPRRFAASTSRAGSLVLGSPAKIRRALSLDEQNDIARWAWSYVETAKYFREFYASQKL